jgi:hypothetical protein
VTLNFGDAPERLYIPFDAVLTFVDPSVEFGLRFESMEGESDDDGALVPAPRAVKESKVRPKIKEVDASKDGRKDADVVSLDTFRK